MGNCGGGEGTKKDHGMTIIGIGKEAKGPFSACLPSQMPSISTIPSLSPLQHKEFRYFIVARFFLIRALRMLGTVAFPQGPTAAWWLTGMLAHSIVGASWAIFYAYFAWSELPVVKPPLAEPSHGIGVRALSREMMLSNAMISDSAMPSRFICA